MPSGVRGDSSRRRPRRHTFRLNEGSSPNVNIRGHSRAPARPLSDLQCSDEEDHEGGAVPQLAEQLGIDIGTLRIFGPDHIILAVVEADDIEAVRNFALQSCLMQWNTVKIHPTYSMEEAVALIDEVETIF